MANEVDMKIYFSSFIEKRNADINEAEKQLEELEKKNDEAQTEDELKNIGSEAEELKAKIAELKAELAEAEAQLAEIDKPAPAEAQPAGEARNLKKLIENRGANKMENEKEIIEERAKNFVETKKMIVSNKEARSTLISGGTLATPTEVGGINDKFNSVSSIVDMVKVVDCSGMGAYKVAYQTADSTATQQTEGTAVEASDPTFNFVTISPTSYEVLSYISKQVKKQTSLNYADKVQKSAKDALRVKAGNVITTALLASSLNQTLDATVTSGAGVIDDKTLRKLALNYGGSNNVMGNAVLFLKKSDLIAFGDVRGTNGNKSAVYEITPDTANPNTGIIKDGGLSVKYCINDNLNACSGTAQTASAIKTMVYGNPQCFELGLFSDYEIAVSEDYKFAENMLTIRGDAEIGGDVTVDKGFVVLTIPAQG